jgi:hypothetical protein
MFLKDVFFQTGFANKGGLRTIWYAAFVNVFFGMLLCLIEFCKVPAAAFNRTGVMPSPVVHPMVVGGKLPRSVKLFWTLATCMWLVASVSLIMVAGQIWS